jgi:hypothetical protein
MNSIYSGQGRGARTVLACPFLQLNQGYQVLRAALRQVDVDAAQKRLNFCVSSSEFISGGKSNFV